MATTVISTIEVKNISAQVVPIYVQPLANSPIYKPQGGWAQVVSKASLEAENSRFDIAGLRQMAKNKLIQYNNLQRIVTLPPVTGSGASF
jgi:hypothetical protein